MSTIEFFFDIGSPYSYLAFHRLQAMAGEANLAVRHRPFLLGAVFKATGNAPPVMVPARGHYMHDDLKRWAQRLDVAFSFPPFFPINSLLPMRALCTLGHADIAPAAAKVFHAYWADNRDVSQPDVLTAILGETAVAGASSREIKEQLRASTDEAVARGAFGAPTFFVRKEMFFGNDRLEFVMDAARRV